MDETEVPEDDARVHRRSELLAEEELVGSDDPIEQARAILEDSEERTLDRDASPGTFIEHRTSEDTVDPPGLSS